MAVVGATSVFLAMPAPLSAQQRGIKPLFEVFGTFSAPPLAPAVRDVYALGGGVRAGGGVGVAAGLMVGRVEVAGFYEGATTTLDGPAQPGSTRGFGRTAIGLRLETLLLESGRGFRLIATTSAFRQELERVAVPPAPSSMALPPRDVTQQAWGGRLEAGVEHRGFIGSSWFVTGGVTMATAGTGRWTEISTARGGLGVQPIVTVGVRTRDWGR